MSYTFSVLLSVSRTVRVRKFPFLSLIVLRENNSMTAVARIEGRVGKWDIFYINDWPSPLISFKTSVLWAELKIYFYLRSMQANVVILSSRSTRVDSKAGESNWSQWTCSNFNTIRQVGLFLACTNIVFVSISLAQASMNFSFIISQWFIFRLVLLLHFQLFSSYSIRVCLNNNEKNS